MENDLRSPEGRYSLIQILWCFDIVDTHYVCKYVYNMCVEQFNVAS